MKKIIFSLLFVFILFSCGSSEDEFFVINNEEAYTTSPDVKVNLWSSYSDRNQTLGQLERYEKVVLVSKDEENNYCHVTTYASKNKKQKDGWLSCDWLQLDKEMSEK